MRTFDSRHYELLGYQSVSLEGQACNVWVFRSRVRYPKDQSASLILVDEAKYVENGTVRFLKPGGRCEDKRRYLVELATQ